MAKEKTIEQQSKEFFERERRVYEKRMRQAAEDEKEVMTADEKAEIAQPETQTKEKGE